MKGRSTSYTSFCFIGGLLVLMTLMFCACSDRPKFSYELKVGNVRTDTPSPLRVQVGEDSIEFDVSFQGGGGK